MSLMVFIVVCILKELDSGILSSDLGQYGSWIGNLGSHTNHGRGMVVLKRCLWCQILDLLAFEGYLSFFVSTMMTEVILDRSLLLSD
jgi:hypothetical protein